MVDEDILYFDGVASYEITKIVDKKETYWHHRDNRIYKIIDAIL